VKALTKSDIKETFENWRNVEDVRCEVFTAMAMKNAVSLDVAPCGFC
jgi:hypothetical protein